MGGLRKFAAKKEMETNAERAGATGLKPAPGLRGYFFRWKDCIENLAGNIARCEAGGPPRFRQMLIETIDACNLRCPMCYTTACGAGGRARLGLEELRRAVEAGRAAGVEAVAVAGRGEPLMDPNLWRLGDFVRENGMDFLVFTNGTMVTPEAARRLKETCTTVITKMFALDAGAHDLLVGVKGEYVKTRRALVELLGAGLRAPNLGIDLVITRQNRDDLENLLRVCRMLGVVPYFERLARTGRGKGLNGNIVLPDGEVDEVFRRLRKVDEAEFGLTWGVVPGMAALANAETDKRMVAVHVDVFGNVQPGLETGHIIGNFRDNGEGIEGVLNDCRAWAAYYRAVAADVGLEAGGEAAEAGAQPVDDAGPVRLPVMQAAYG